MHDVIFRRCLLLWENQHISKRKKTSRKYYKLFGYSLSERIVSVRAFGCTSPKKASGNGFYICALERIPLQSVRGFLRFVNFCQWAFRTKAIPIIIVSRTEENKTRKSHASSKGLYIFAYHNKSQISPLILCMKDFLHPVMVLQLLWVAHILFYLLITAEHQKQHRHVIEGYATHHLAPL